MGQIDLDRPIQRRGTDSFKWDGVGRFFGRDDAIPMWVADMDFPCAPEILDAFQARLRHGIMGYTLRSEGYISALRGWFLSRHGWDIPEAHLAFAPPGVIFAVNVLLELLTRPGDRVVMQTPNYDALMESVEKSGRRIAENPLRVEEGRYELDFDGLEEILADPATKVLLMANPNNPTGRLWTREELTRLGEMCLEHGVVVLTDDIHCDIVMPGHRYVPLPSVSPKIARNTVLITSTNKTFNLGGLQLATLVIGDDGLREGFNGEMLRYQTRLDNLFGALALETAYTSCGYWVDQVIGYVAENRRVLAEYAAEYLPQLRLCPMDATYFAWIDFSGLGKGAALEDFLIRDCGVAFTPGREFHPGCGSFMRVNLACRRETMLAAFERIRKAVG